MPLDTGDMAIQSADPSVVDDLALLRPGQVQLSDEMDVGSALAGARRRLGLEVEDIASATRVRSGYIRAIEAFDFAALPARPFTIGYVRAYATALGLDAGAVVRRFRQEAPPVEDDLKAPVTVERPRSVGPRLIGGTAVMVVTAVVAWNVWRHAEARPLPTAPPAPEAVAPPLGPVALGAPPPTPPEASTPPAYQTPGLPPPSGATTAPARATPTR
jgi:cytoskeletal protein RodZ